MLDACKKSRVPLDTLSAVNPMASVGGLAAGLCVIARNKTAKIMPFESEIVDVQALMMKRLMFSDPMLLRPGVDRPSGKNTTFRLDMPSTELGVMRA